LFVHPNLPYLPATALPCPLGACSSPASYRTEPATRRTILHSMKCETSQAEQHRVRQKHVSCVQKVLFFWRR
jgi:hypothetical protein